MKKTTTIKKNLKVAMDIATKQGTSMQHKTNYKKRNKIQQQNKNLQKGLLTNLHTFICLNIFVKKKEDHVSIIKLG